MALRPLLARAEASGAVRPHPNQRVAPRRIIVELHSEWGLPTSFFADVAQAHAHAHAHAQPDPNPHPNPHPNSNHDPNPDPNPDRTQLRALYEPLGCRVTLGTVLRHPIAWYLSLFNWRASNAIPLCQWQPPADGISRQVRADA